MKRFILEKETLPPAILQDIDRVKTILLDYGANRIILYGSLARGDYRADSDIDICTEGMPDENYFRALAECLMNIQRPVSILDLKNAHGYFRERVFNEGKILYGPK